MGELPAAPVVLSTPCSPPPSILFIVGDPTGPTCSEFMPSALVWLLGPCPWLFPGNIASNYTTRGAQPLRYHAKFQTDLTTTTSRTQTQWGRPPPRRVFKKTKHNPKKHGSHCTSRSTLFPHRKTSKVSCCSCSMHCAMLIFLHLLRLESGIGITQIPKASKTLIFSMVNSEWLNSPTSQNHFQINANSSQVSKTVLFVHKLAKTSCSFRKMQNAVWLKKKVGLLLLTNDMHIQEK